MKAGDLIKLKKNGWLGIVLSTRHAGRFYPHILAKVIFTKDDGSLCDLNCIRAEDVEVISECR